MPDRFREIIDRSALVLLLLALIVFTIHCIVAHDVWWQLATGEWVLSHGFPSTDPFSYYAPDRPWIEMRWLYCVVLHLIHRGFGLNALIVAKSLLLVATFGLLWWAVRDRRRWAASFGIACALALAHSRFQIRPELVSFLLLVVTLVALHRYKTGGDRRWIYALPIVQIMWTNSHTLFILGPAVVWIVLTSEWLAARLPFGPFRNEPDRMSTDRLRPLAIVAVLVSVACLASPYFIEGALFPFQLFRQIREGDVLDTLIDEFRSPFELAGWTFFFLSYVVVAALSAATFWINRRRVSLSLLGTWSAFLYLSTLAQRNLALFGIVAGFAVAVNLSQTDVAGDMRDRLQTWISWTARGATVVFALVMIPLVASDAYYRRTDTAKRFGFGVAEYRFPIRAMAFVRAEGLPVPVLNSLGDGGYVLFEGGPKSVFIDGRLEVYGGQIVREGLRVIQYGEGVDAVADRFGIATIVVRHMQEPGLLQTLDRSRAWAPVYYDEGHVVYLRVSPATQALVDRLRIDWKQPIRREVAVPAELDPPDWLAGLWPKVAVVRDDLALGQLFIAIGNLELAEQHYANAVRRDPGEESARLFLGLIYRATGRDAEAAEQLAFAADGVLERADVQAMSASICETAGNPAAAVEAYQRAIALGNRSVAASAGLARSAIAANRLEVARAALLDVAKATPNDPAAWNNLGVVAAKLGNSAESLKYFETSLRANPNQPAVLNQVGVLKLQSGDPAGARSAFARAIEIDPSYQPARENLAKLRG